MKKMTKGAIITGVGVALLLGGGGTLALWNDTWVADAGTIKAGELELKDVKEAVWIDETTGEVIPKIDSYRIIPGDQLTYTQEFAVDLAGDHMQAELSHSGVPTNDSTNNTFSTLEVSEIVLTEKGSETPISGPLTAADDDKVFIASSTFTFPETTKGRTDTNAFYNLSHLTFQLEQVRPTTP